MSGTNPSQPSQPHPNQAYSTLGNPASKEPAEKAQSAVNAQDDSAPVDQRIPRTQADPSEATPSSLGRGIRGAGPGENPNELSDQDQCLSKDVNAEQMEVPGEGKVAGAVKGWGKTGAGGQERGFETDLDRKKAEQAPLREKMQEEQKREVDVGGVLGQRGGPASTVD